ncbi:hypothetical protein QCD60_06675 [Pokkaliibacter sp. MBI-7]|uniref:hypothetical protein n=1 Tax=Pokkaliibacter sp. MBI-7 TaxID=3040600 RepID=UPI00244876B2|nr:hypothetical protein [Pokkaliibacter sp. MBI-7]MDH2432242.1 hypothetical protein [Pokkaliibacter sp. MBI-7]
MIHPVFWQPVAELIASTPATEGPLMLCITGNSGCGKSTLGRWLRKQGMPGIKPRQIMVIDDGVARISFLGLLKRRLRFRSKEKDYLAPFKPYFAGKKLVVFISCHPSRRIDNCDILLQVSCNDDLRLTQLRQRERDGDKRYQDTAHYQLNPPHHRWAFNVHNDGQHFRFV